MTSATEDFTREAGINIKLLKFCGIVLDVRTIPTAASNAFATISFLCLTLYSVTYTYIFVFHINNLEAASAYLSLVMSFIGGESRFCILLWFRSKIMKMLKQYDKLWLNLSGCEKRKIQLFLNKSRLITLIYLSFCAFTILSYSIAFVLQPKDTEGNRTTARQLPYVFLFEVTETPYYEVMYTVQMISIVNVGFTCVACDTTGMFFVMATCGHFSVIYDRIMQLCKIFIQNDESEFHRRLELDVITSCIPYHQTVLKLCEEIEEIINIIFLTGLIGTTYNLSLMGFKLTSNDPAKLTYMFQSAILIMQLFVYNWPPDLLVTHSFEISRAVWYSPWYNCSTNTKMLFEFVIRRAYRPVRLTAGKLFYLSLENFASMISAAASFFTVLSTVK